MLEIVEREALGLSDASPAFSAAKLPRDLPAVRTARGLRVPSVRRRACDRVGRAFLRAAVNIGSGLADKAACAGRAAQPRVGLPVIAAPWIRGPGPRKADQPTRDAPSEAAVPLAARSVGELQSSALQPGGDPGSVQPPAYPRMLTKWAQSTRLETRTKESNICASVKVKNLWTRNESESLRQGRTGR